MDISTLYEKFENASGALYDVIELLEKAKDEAITVSGEIKRVLPNHILALQKKIKELVSGSEPFAIEKLIAYLDNLPLASLKPGKAADNLDYSLPSNDNVDIGEPDISDGPKSALLNEGLQRYLKPSSERKSLRKRPSTLKFDTLKNDNKMRERKELLNEISYEDDSLPSSLRELTSRKKDGNKPHSGFYKFVESAKVDLEKEDGTEGLFAQFDGLAQGFQAIRENTNELAESGDWRNMMRMKEGNLDPSVMQALAI
jgi:hypothetical protein